MVGQRRRATKKPAARLGNHQKSWLWGRHVVLETLRAGRWRPVEVLIAPGLNHQARDEVRAACAALGVPLIDAPAERLTQLCHARDHQGLLARMPPFPYATEDDLLAAVRPSTARSSAACPLLLVLDGLQDPFNLGAVCRAACVFGADGILIGAGRQAKVTSQVARSSAGAVNRLMIARTEDLPGAVGRFRKAGIRILAATPDAAAPIDRSDLRGPLVLVIGNEGSGVSPEVLAECDARVSIPQVTDFDSLNAAVAAGVLLYEVSRQRRGR